MFNFICLKITSNRIFSFFFNFNFFFNTNTRMMHFLTVFYLLALQSIENLKQLFVVIVLNLPAQMILRIK